VWVTCSSSACALQWAGSRRILGGPKAKRRADPRGVPSAALRARRGDVAADRLERLADCDSVASKLITYPAAERSTRSRVRVLRYWHDSPRRPHILAEPLAPEHERASSRRPPPLALSAPDCRRRPRRPPRSTRPLSPASKADAAALLARLGTARRQGLCTRRVAEEHEPVDFWGVLPFDPPMRRHLRQGPCPRATAGDPGRYTALPFLSDDDEPFGGRSSRVGGRLQLIVHATSCAALASIPRAGHRSLRLLATGRGLRIAGLSFHPQNAPWSLGLRQQGRALRARLAPAHDLGISAFHGLSNSPSPSPVSNLPGSVRAGERHLLAMR